MSSAATRPRLGRVWLSRRFWLLSRKERRYSRNGPRRPFARGVGIVADERVHEDRDVSLLRVMAVPCERLAVFGDLGGNLVDGLVHQVAEDADAEFARLDERVLVDARQPHRKLPLHRQREQFHVEIRSRPGAHRQRFAAPEFLDGLDVLQTDFFRRRSKRSGAKMKSFGCQPVAMEIPVPCRGKGYRPRTIPPPRGPDGAAAARRCRRAGAMRLRVARQGSSEQRGFGENPPTAWKWRSGSHTAAKPCWSANRALSRMRRYLSS